MLCIENLKEYDYSLVKSKFAFWLALGKEGNWPYSGYYYHNNELLFCFFEDYTNCYYLVKHISYSNFFLEKCFDSFHKKNLPILQQLTYECLGNYIVKLY